MIDTVKPPLDEDLLIHYGVKGMKWGQRKSGRKNPVPVMARPGFAVGQAIARRNTTPDVSGVTRRQAKLEVRNQNKKLTRSLEDFESSPNRSAMIRGARAKDRRVMRDYEDVAADIKAKKKSGELGRNAAKIELNKARNERYENIYKSDSKTTGEQFIDALFNPDR